MSIKSDKIDATYLALKDDIHMEAQKTPRKKVKKVNYGRKRSHNNRSHATVKQMCYGCKGNVQKIGWRCLGCDNFSHYKPA